MRARKVVTRSGKRFRGKFPSAKMGTMVHWESLYERDAILHLEYHPLVVSYQEQPSIETYYDAAGIPHRYYPDFVARLAHGEERYFEVKPERFLAKPDVREKLDAVARHFEGLGRQFRVLTERDIRREPLFSNLRKIHRGAHSASSREVTQRLISQLDVGPAWRFGDLETRLGGDHSVLRLIGIGHLCVDLETELRDDTVVRLASHGGSHDSFRI